MAGPRGPRKKKAAPAAAAELRRGAEERLDELSAAATTPVPEELAPTMHELRVHQIELEMQNEELRGAQLALDAQRAKYYDLFDLAPVGYLTISDKGIVGEANLTAAHLLGVERRLLVGQPFSAFVLAADRDAYYRHLELLKQTGAPQSCELRLQRVGAEPFWARIEGQPRRGADGETLSSWVTFTDVTARKRAEEALRESEANFHAFFDAVDDMIVVGAPDGRIAYANPAVSAKLGYSAAEVRGLHVLDLNPTGRRAEAEAIFAAMLRGERDSCPLPLQSKSGALVPAETRVWFGRWDGADCVFGVCKDLTTEQEALQKFEQLFRGNPSLMALSDLPERRFTDVNEAFLSTLGYSREEVLGHTSEELRLAVEPQQQLAIAEQLQAQGRVADRELKVRRKDGTILDGLFSGEVIESQGRRYFLTVMSDQTERKQAAEALLTSLAETDRTNRLMQGRETRILEMKLEVNVLCAELGREPVYRGRDEPGSSGVAIQVSRERVAGDATGHAEASGTVAAPSAAIQHPIRDLGLEKPEIDMAFIPILCSAPLFYAKTHGYFARNGLDVTLTPAPGWSGVKDLLAFGHTDAAHLLSPMPLAIRQGLDGRRADIRLACIQNVNGQALTLAKRHAAIKDVRDMKGFTFGVPYFFSMHYYLLCLFLAEHELNPLKDVTIVEVAPPQMPYYVESGRVDGVFGPEPFNQISVSRGTGFIYTLSKEIWQGHPCCCLASTEELIARHPRTYKAMLSSVLEAELALHRASPDERREIAVELSRLGILNQSDPEPVAQALSGEYDDGTGLQCIDHDRMDFLPTPWPEYGAWILSQQQRWSQLRRRVDYREVVERCFDAATSDLARNMGFEEPEPKLGGLKTFRGADPFAYMRTQPFCAFEELGENEAPPIEQRIARLSDLMAIASGGRGLPDTGAAADDAFGVLERLTGDMFKNMRFTQDGLREQNEIVLRGRQNLMSIAEDAEAAQRIAMAAEEALRESEEKHRLLIENSHDIIYTLTADGLFTFVSPAWTALLGHPVDHVVGQPFQQFVHPDDLPGCMVFLQAVIETGQRQEGVEYRVRRLDGSWYWHTSSAVPLKDEAGATIGFEGTARDITERRRAEDALRESEERHKEMIAGISDVIAIMAVDGTLRYESPNIERHFGWLPEDLVGTDGWETVHPDDLERIQGEFLALLDEDASVATVEYRYKCKDGGYKSIELTATNLTNSPLIDGVLMNYHDITARKRTEEERKQAAQALAHLNDELVAEAAALAEANAAITRIAATDDLTGLANRRCFYEALEKAVSLARRHGSPLALVSVDLDGLKRVNDSAGHEAGDEVLTSFADRLAALCRIEDLPGRLGGDEFSVLLPGIDLGGALGLAERVLAAVRSCEALTRRGVTVSGGAAQWTPGELPDDLLRRADDALYAAKRGGGDAVEVDRADR